MDALLRQHKVPTPRASTGKPLRPPRLTERQTRLFFGGNSFPTVTATGKGTRFRYPAPSNAAGWTRLLNAAVQWRFRELLAVHQGRQPRPNALENKYKYVLYEIHPGSRRKRAIRGNHRRMHGLAVGDPRHVHHRDQRTMAFSRTVVLTPCQHKQIHGQRCVKEGQGRKKSAARRV